MNAARDAEADDMLDALDGWHARVLAEDVDDRIISSRREDRSRQQDTNRHNRKRQSGNDADKEAVLLQPEQHIIAFGQSERQTKAEERNDGDERRSRRDDVFQCPIFFALLLLPGVDRNLKIRIAEERAF